MSEPADLLVPGGLGAGLGAFVFGLLKWSGNRNISALDKTLSELTTAVVELRKEVQQLREAHVGLARDVGSLQKDNELLRQRLDGLAKHWAEKFEDAGQRRRAR